MSPTTRPAKRTMAPRRPPKAFLPTVLKRTKAYKECATFVASISPAFYGLFRAFQASVLKRTKAYNVQNPLFSKRSVAYIPLKGCTLSTFQGRMARKPIRASGANAWPK